MKNRKLNMVLLTVVALLTSVACKRVQQQETLTPDSSVFMSRDASSVDASSLTRDATYTVEATTPEVSEVSH